MSRSSVMHQPKAREEFVQLWEAGVARATIAEHFFHRYDVLADERWVYRWVVKLGLELRGQRRRGSLIEECSS